LIRFNDQRDDIELREGMHSMKKQRPRTAVTTSITLASLKPWVNRIALSDADLAEITGGGNKSGFSPLCGAGGNLL
jgi:hypothetical protein